MRDYQTVTIPTPRVQYGEDLNAKSAKPAKGRSIPGAQLNIGFGTSPNDATGDTLRTFAGKTQTNFTELYGNLASLSNTVANLTVGSATNKLTITSNLADVASPATALSNLGGASQANLTTVSNNVNGKLAVASNLLDVASVPAARSNLVAETRRTFNVLDYGAIGDGATDDTLAIRAAITAAGTNSILTFPAGKTFLHRGAFNPLTDQTWMMYGAKLKRANEASVTFATAITNLSGAHTITVASTNGFFVGMDVSVFNGSSYDPSSHRITAMTATTITIGTDFTTAFPSGGILVTAFAQIQAVNVPRVRLFGGEFDGNRANNTSLQKWELNVEIYLASDGGTIRDVYVHDAQSEGIELAGVNVTVDHCRVEDCQGNGIHLFATEHPTIRSTKVKNCNLSGTATGHADGCIIASNVVGDWKIEDCWLENGIAGVGSFDSTDNSRLLIHGCTFTNFTTYAIEANLPDATDVSDAIVTDNKFFNAGAVHFGNNSSDPTSVYGPKNIIFANNLLEDTRIITTLVRGVTLSGNTISNSTTTQVNINVTDVKDFTATGNLIVGGGFGFYVTSGLGGGTSNGTNNVNVSIRNNTLKNQYTTGINMNRPGIINGSVIGNTILAQIGASVNPSAYVGIFANDGAYVSENNVFVDSGLYGIQLGTGVSGFGGAQVFNNKVITSGSVATIKTSGGSTGGYIGGNLVSSAIQDSGAPNNFIGFNRVIGDPLRTGTGVMVASSGATTTNETLVTPTISGAMTLPDNVRQAFNPGATVAGLNVGAQAGDPGTLINGDIWYDSTGNLLRARINGASVSLGPGGGVGDVTAAATFGTDNRLVRSDGTGKGVQGSSVDVDDSGNISTPGTVTSGSGGGAGSVTIGDGGTHTFRVAPPTLSTDINLIPDTAPGNGFLLGTVTGTTNETLTHVGSTGSGNVVRQTSPTITTPTIADLSNAQHGHTNAASGGALAAAAITSGVFPIARLATGTPDGTKFIRDDGALVTPTGTADFRTLLTVNDTYIGNVRSGFNNSGGVTQWDAVYLNGSSQWVKASSSGGGSAYPCRGLATATAATGNATTILLQGTIRHEAWSWTPGGTIYLGQTAGSLTQTVPVNVGDIIQPIGYALSATTMAVEISPTYTTVIATYPAVYDTDSNAPEWDTDSNAPVASTDS